MEDIDGVSARERRRDPGRTAHVVSVHEHPDISAQMPGLVPEFETKPRIPLFENVEEVPDRVGVDLLTSAGTEFPQPAVEVNVEHDRSEFRVDTPPLLFNFRLGDER